MIRMRKIVVLFSTLPLVLGAAFALAKDIEVEGTIQNVNDDNRSITVQFEETGAMQTFSIDNDTEISFERTGVSRQDLRRGFEDLNTGQEVTLRFDDEMMNGEWVIVRFLTVS